MSGYPAEIEQFHHTLLSIPGVSSVESSIDNLEAVDVELLSVSEYAHLPHAALLRTQGGLENEVLLQFEFVLEPSAEGWQALEFLGWFVRDQARGGIKVQLRPYALPPESPNGRQLGRTLKFHLDLFVDGVTESLKPALQAVAAMNDSLKLATQLYRIATKP